MYSFLPSPGATVNIDVSSSSQSTVLARINEGPYSIRVMNNGTATVWIQFGDSTVAATLTASMPVGPGVTEVLSGMNSAGGGVYVAAIAAGSTGKIYFTRGRGI